METLPPPALPAATPLSDYHPPAGVFDELKTPDGEVRAHWQAFHAGIQALGPTEIHHRWDQARQLVRENRVCYNLSVDGRARTRVWPLDPFPLLIDDSEWRRLEAGLAQRARLLNRLLADLYGPQLTVQRRLLPPELVYHDHGGLLRACAGVTVPFGIYLHFYGADIGRQPDGSWVVLRDKTQAPSGPAYSLENRFIVSRTLPDLFRDCHAERLSPFFRSWRDTLGAFAPQPVDVPRVVLLTPGPEHESYFEHAYLARYLGYTLVEGEDLTVRDGSVFLKTVSKLHPVDIILRRIDDAWADPLELSAGALEGVTGLLNAIRQKRVTVVNALGTGVAQLPALMAFLPGLCRALLGEELLLPSVPTVWCGQPAGLAQVEERLARMVVEPCFPRSGLDPVFGERLTRKQRIEMLDRIREKPSAWVAHDKVNFSTVPTLAGDRMTPGHAVLRTFSLAHPDGHWEIMPGGLSRTSTDLRSLLVSVERGGGSKDCWVVSDAAHRIDTPPPASVESIELRRGDGDMPSRVADTLYWLGRYVERSESVARILRCLLIRTMDRTDLEALPEVEPLLVVLTNGRSKTLFEGDGPPPWERLQQELLALSLQPRRSGSLKKWLNEVGRLSSRVRDRWTPDAWRNLTQLASAMHHGSSDRPIDSSRLMLLLNRLILQLAAFSGLAYENTTRNLELRVIDIGRRLERAIHMVELLDAALCHSASRESTVLEALLDIGDSAITYRQRYLTGLNGTAVLDLLLCDESNPRSVAFQLAILEKHLARMPQDKAEAGLSPEHRVLLACVAELRLSNVAHLYQAVEGRRPLLTRLCDRLLTNLPLLSDVISQRHLSHAPKPQQLSLFPDR